MSHRNQTTTAKTVILPKFRQHLPKIGLPSDRASITKQYHQTNKAMSSNQGLILQQLVNYTKVPPHNFTKQ